MFFEEHMSYMLSILLLLPFSTFVLSSAAVTLRGSTQFYAICSLCSRKRALEVVSTVCAVFHHKVGWEEEWMLLAVSTLSTSHPFIAPLFLSLNFSSHFASFMCSQPTRSSISRLLFLFSTFYCFCVCNCDFSTNCWFLERYLDLYCM